MAQPGFYFCVCPDGRLIKEHIETCLAALPDHGAGWERHTYWGDEELPPQFWEQLTLQGLFGTSRVVLVRNAQNIPAAVWKRLSAALGAPNPQCLPMFCLEVAWEKNQPKIPAHIAKLRCLAFADKQKWIWRSPGLDERSLKKHVQTRAQALGLTFAPGALEVLCAGVPPDANAVENELQKLTLAAGSGPVTQEMAASAGYVPEFNIFAFIRMIQAGNVPGAWQEVRRGQKDGDGLLFPFLGMLLREARLLWQIHAGENVRLHPSDAAAKQQLAARLGHQGLTRLFDLILRAELHVKSGERQPDQTLEALIADLIRLFRPAGRS